MPFLVHVAFRVVTALPQLCDASFMFSAFVAPQTEHVYVLTPVFAHVAFCVVTALPQVWDVMGIFSFFVAPHTVQV